MGVGDYVCVTLRGGAPWGFTIAQGEGDTYRPLVVSKVEEGGCAFLAGIQESDHVVSINGEPCADMTLLQAFALIDTSSDGLQLLLKRHSGTPSEDYDPDETSCGEGELSGDAVESTTLHIVSPKHRCQSPTKPYISESQDEAYYGEMDSDTEIHKGPQSVCTQLHMHPSSVDQRVLELGNDKVSVSFSPGDMVELQVSLAKSTLHNTGCKSLGSACDTEEAPITPASHNAPRSAREPLSHHGVVLSSPSMLGQVEVILQGPAASGAGRGIQGVRGGVGGPKVSCAESQSEGEEGAGVVHCEEVPRSFTVSFGIPSEEATETEEPGSDSEEDPDRPNRHRARHARLRRSESLSEKQVKEAKSKCKRIALLLKAAPPNPNNKGVLMFKKHRQRAKKYTLVSYGTGEEDPEYRSEEDEDNEENRDEAHTVEFTLVPSKDTDSEPHFITNANSGKGGLSINWDKGLLEIERNLNNQVKMECLPDTKGKGALMFAQRRQRMDEISAEHDELRRQGIPVEGLPEVQKKIEEHAYMQSAIEGHAYMDVNMHQQTQHQQQYQQYQEQQYYEQQQQHYQQQQQYQQQYQQQQYEQQHYQQQQMYQQQQTQQQQEYHQAQQQFQQYSANVNGTVHHQTNEMQSSLSNRTAQPFSPENMAPTTYSPAMSGNNQESQGEQIASRDERISTPAIKTGILLDTRRKNAAKPMFTFKEAPKVSPNPALLNLLNRNDKKMGFESGPEEDYLSLGAEACNFLQSQRLKHKIPPPVAPKPMINPTAPPWTAQMEMTNQDMPQCAENSLITPAAAPPPEMTPAPEPAPAPAPAPEPSTPSAPQEVPTSTATEDQQAWSAPALEPQQQPVQMTAASAQMNSTLQIESSLAVSWPTAQQQAQQQSSANSWHQAQAQLQEPLPSQSPPQPPWVSRQPAPIQPQPQLPTTTWNPQIQQTWVQPQEQVQTQAQPTWVPTQEQPSSQPQVQPPWAHAQEQPHLQPMHPTFGQPQEQMQQPQAPWAQQSSRDSQPQPPWVQQPQQKPQVQALWVQQAPESQPQPPWVQPPQHQAPQQAWPQTQSPSQPQPPWAQPQQQQHSWTPPQAQAQPPWVQANQAPPQPQANLNPWAPVPPQAQPQQPWVQPLPEHSQQPMNAWGPEQNQPQHQPPWVQPTPPQPAPQPNWQQPSVKTPPQPPLNWPPAQTTPPNSWAQPSQQTPVTTSIVNTRPSPKPWQPPQNRSPPPPPQRMSSFTLGQRTSSPINPMATVLNPSSAGSAFEMPTVKGKGADMFAKRQSRMEKFVVDSETVEANKASRSTSPVASLPTEWKYTPNALGRSYSLSPPARVPFTGQQSFSASASPRPSAFPPSARQTSWLERGKKAPTPWEAASRHPLGLVDEAFTFQDLQQTLASSVHLAAQRKILPEPPADWKARVSYQTHTKTGSQSQTRGHSRAPLPSFVSPTKNSVSGLSGYRSLPRQWQPQRSVTEANLSSTDYKRPQGAHAYKSVYTSNTSWSWKQ